MCPWFDFQFLNFSSYYLCNDVFRVMTSVISPCLEVNIDNPPHKCFYVCTFIKESDSSKKHVEKHHNRHKKQRTITTKLLLEESTMSWWVLNENHVHIPKSDKKSQNRLLRTTQKYIQEDVGVLQHTDSVILVRKRRIPKNPVTREEREEIHILILHPSQRETKKTNGYV